MLKAYDGFIERRRSVANAEGILWLFQTVLHGSWSVTVSTGNLRCSSGISHGKPWRPSDACVCPLSRLQLLTKLHDLQGSGRLCSWMRCKQVTQVPHHLRPTALCTTVWGGKKPSMALGVVFLCAPDVCVLLWHNDLKGEFCSARIFLVLCFSLSISLSNDKCLSFKIVERWGCAMINFLG